MPADPPIQDASTPRPKPFQFTIRSLLVATTLTAIFLSCLFGGSSWIAIGAAVLVIYAVPVVLITILVYGPGYQRTFCIGALTFVVACLTVPYGLPYSFVFDLEYEDGIAPRCYVLIGLLVGILFTGGFGLLAVVVRRMVEPVPSTTENHPPESSPDEPQSPFGSRFT